MNDDWIPFYFKIYQIKMKLKFSPWAQQDFLSLSLLPLFFSSKIACECFSLIYYCSVVYSKILMSLYLSIHSWPLAIATLKIPLIPLGIFLNFLLYNFLFIILRECFLDHTHGLKHFCALIWDHRLFSWYLFVRWKFILSVSGEGVPFTYFPSFIFL